MSTEMRLSEAIREGAKLAPKCVGRWVAKDEAGRVVACCAIGGAILVVGFDIDHRDADLSDIYRLFAPVLKATFNQKRWGYDVMQFITSVNDSGVSRELIADWVEVVEETAKRFG